LDCRKTILRIAPSAGMDVSGIGCKQKMTGNFATDLSHSFCPLNG
jgi:hypothetical protein